MSASSALSTLERFLTCSASKPSGTLVLAALVLSGVRVDIGEAPLPERLSGGILWNCRDLTRHKALDARERSEVLSTGEENLVWGSSSDWRGKYDCEHVGGSGGDGVSLGALLG